MRNFSNVFQNIEDGFLGNLALSKAQSQLIISARIKIQEWLKQGISERLKKLENVSVEPRFMSQGSAVYKTQNQSCFVPPQQIDHDLGCYLPLSVAKNISDFPNIVSKVFFTIVDDLLEELVKKEKWDGIDTSKKTCSRVIVTSEIHIDIPLYAIPDTEFTAIRERIDKSLGYENFSTIQSNRSTRWRNEDIKTVLLAHRDLNWKESDPRKLNEYFRKEFLYKGEQLRRICRYIKAWRDYQWKDGGPSSIYLMLFADKTVDAEIDRDDLALLNVLQEICQLLGDETYQVINPTDSKEIIDIPDEDREKLKKLSKSFSDDLRVAINCDTISDEEAVRLIQKNLGSRFPDRGISPTPPSVREVVFSTPVSQTEERRPSTRTRAG